MQIEGKDVTTAIYEWGKTHLNSFVIPNTDKVAYSDLTIEEYLKENPQCVAIPFNEAMQEIEKAETEKYITDWEEITVDDYDWYLNCLPPVKWKTVDGVNIFYMSEFQTGNITRHCCRYNGKYYTAHRRTSTSYEEIAEQIKKL